MAFETACPKCQKRVRVNQTALGSMLECQGCFQEFRVVPAGPGGGAATPLKEKPQPMEDSGMELLQAIRGGNQQESRQPDPPSYTDRGPRLSGGKPMENIPGFIAVAIALLALLSAQIPIVEYLVGPLAVGAVILAVLSGFICEGGLGKRLTLPALALTVAIPTLIILFVNPHWFRNKPFEPEPELPRDKFLLSSPGNRPILPEKEGMPVNAKQYEIQRNDIRVAIGNASYVKAEFVQMNKKQFTREPKIHLLVRTRNCGLESPFEFPSWKTFGSVKLFDSSGIELKEWEPPKGVTVRPVPERSVFPDKYIDEEFIFDPPKEKFNELKLVLPAKGFGEKEGEVTFLIPSSVFVYR